MKYQLNLKSKFDQKLLTNISNGYTHQSNLLKTDLTLLRRESCEDSPGLNYYPRRQIVRLVQSATCFRLN
jgi:hypothetical protein